MNTVFFTGHRDYTFNFEESNRAVRLIAELVVKNEVLDFYAGGAQGWDMRFENMVLNIRDTFFSDVKLHLVLPCPPDEQTANWDIDDKDEYQRILEAADSVEIVSPHYDKSCMKKRNQRLAELGDVCVCYYNEKRTRSGTGQTVRMAEKMGKEIINIYVERTES